MNLSSLGYLLREGAKNVWLNRLMSLASVGVLISCLILTGSAFMFSINIKDIMDNLQSENVITIYLDQDATPQQALDLENVILAIPNIESCEFVSKDQALQQYTEMLGPIFDEIADEENFLPDSYRITMSDLSLYDDTIEQVKTLDLVDTINDRSDAASKLSRLNKLVTTTSFWLILILGFISLFIISNTIKMTMYSRKLEISIMKSVGATNAFIRIPFLVEGMIIGVSAALVSSLLLRVFYNSVSTAISQIIPFQKIPFNDVAATVLIGFLATGFFFGFAGGLVSINRYLKRDGGSIIA